MGLRRETMYQIKEIKMKCDQCGEEKFYHNIDIDGCEYNQFVITICDMDEPNFEGYCDCMRE